MNFMTSLLYFLVLIVSIVVHEVAHGLAAESQGDPTARMLGRITMNPIKHADPIGSIVLPLILLVSGSNFFIGWAKPVPYNPVNFRNERKGTRIVSMAGIVANFSIAIIVGLAIRVMMTLHLGSLQTFEIMSIIVLVNIVLGIFNLIPIPPLDGFRFLESALPVRFGSFFKQYEQYGIAIMIVFLLVGVRFIGPLASLVYTVITGIPLS
jgi:Zn-dependent protease